jgi:hypothetical protein
MWRRVLALGAAFAFVASMSYAGTVTRGTKSAGGTDFTDGTTIVTDEVNVDFNTLYTLVNGNIDTANIATDGVDSAEIAADAVEASELANDSVASANIIDSTIVDADLGAVTGAAIQDYSNDEPEAALSVDPGTTGSESLATDLEGEIERLRYAIARLAIGTTADASTWAWFDGPYRSGNLVYNGSFEATDGTGSAASTTVAEGWTNLSTSTIAYTDPTDVSEGEGVAMQTTASGGTFEGAGYTIKSPKASTTYLLVARVKPTAGDSCRLRFWDATTSVTDTTTSDGAYETLSVVGTTTAVPADIQLQITSVADGDVCDWDHVGAYEISPDPIPKPGIVRVRAEYSGASADCGATFGAASCNSASTGLSVALTPPGPNYLVIVDAHINAGTDTGTHVCEWRLYDSNANMDLEVINTVLDDQSFEVTLHGTSLDPTPGITLTYTADGRDTAGDCDIRNDFTSWIEALLIPMGGQ